MNLVKSLADIVSLFFICLLYTGCVGSKAGSVKNGEQLNMTIKEKKDVVNFNALKEQPTESLADRGKAKARGIGLSPVTGMVISLATNAIKNVIANEKKKYTASYEFALTDLYFYDQLSNESAFDPVGIQFSGFKIVRTFINSKGETDTAFTASFSLDKTNVYEILNNSVFRLKLDDIKVNYAKAKIAAGGKKEVNMDIEIGIYSSYVNRDAVLFDNVNLGDGIFDSLAGGTTVDPRLQIDYFFIAFVEGTDRDATGGAAIVLENDNVLGDVDQFAGHVAGVSGLERGVGETFARSVGGDEVFQHR